MSRWRSKSIRGNDDQERKAKRSITVTLTESAITYLQEKKSDHESRSAYLETLMWKGVRQEELAKKLMAKDPMVRI